MLRLQMLPKHGPKKHSDALMSWKTLADKINGVAFDLRADLCKSIPKCLHCAAAVANKGEPHARRTSSEGFARDGWWGVVCLAFRILAHLLTCRWSCRKQYAYIIMVNTVDLHVFCTLRWRPEKEEKEEDANIIISKPRKTEDAPWFDTVRLTRLRC